MSTVKVLVQNSSCATSCAEPYSSRSTGGLTPETHEYKRFRLQRSTTARPVEHSPKHALAWWWSLWNRTHRGVIHDGEISSVEAFACLSLAISTRPFFESVRITSFLGVNTVEGLLHQAKANPTASRKGVVVRHRALLSEPNETRNEAANLTVLRKLADPGVEGCLYAAGTIQAPRGVTNPHNQTLKGRRRIASSPKWTLVFPCKIEYSHRVPCCWPLSAGF